MVIGVTPSVYVTFQGAVPVRAKLSVAVCPLQMAGVPLNVTVGLEFTVTVALPLRSAAIEAHLLSLEAVREYIVVAVGDTVNV